MMHMRMFRMTAGFRRRLMVGGRVAGCTSALSFGLAWCWVDHVSAEIEQSSFSLGERLVDELGDVVAEPQAIVVNGQTAWIASKTTPLSVSEALDRFDAHCVSRSRALSTNLEGLEAESATPSPAGPSIPGQRLLIRRDEIPDQGGQLVCLTPTEPLTGYLDLGSRLGTFFATGELGAIGEMRYARVKSRPEGGSHVITVWSAGAFNLFDALPGDTDAPGNDPDQAPRPPEASRILSARVPGRGYAVFSYVSQRTSTELLQFYATEMPKRGWTPLDAERYVPETEALSTMARAYFIGDAVTYVVVDDTSEANTSRATATLVQAGAPRAAVAVSPELAN
jgi:hypothetical protein